MAGVHVLRHRVEECLRRREFRKTLREIDRAGVLRQARHHREDGGADVGKAGIYGTRIVHATFRAGARFTFISTRMPA